MRKPWAVFIIAVIAAVRAVPCEAQTDEIAFTHVAVVDVQSGNISSDMTVLITGQKIREVGSSRVVHVPKQAHSADARGKYLIPALSGHARPQLVECRAACYVLPPVSSNGVTGVREMGGPMLAADQVLWRDQVASGAVIDPRLIVPGPFVDGPHPVWPGSIVAVDGATIFVLPPARIERAAAREKPA